LMREADRLGLSTTPENFDHRDGITTLVVLLGMWM
jgi:hypothetical protein